MKAHTSTIRVVAAVIAALTLLWALAQSAAPPAQALFEDTDGDGASDVAEGVFGSDDNDAGSVPEDGTFDYLQGTLRCSDFDDNDGDGLTDGFDTGCVDHDGDVISDQVENAIGSDPFDAGSTPEDAVFSAVLNDLGFFAFPCFDGLDNDGDGATDAADSGCITLDRDDDTYPDDLEKWFGSDPDNAASVPEHETVNEGSCSDGDDNDLDGQTDLEDPTCVSPANDDRADAQVISNIPAAIGPQVIKNATRESGEPFSNCFSSSQTVWYKFTPAENLVVIADTIGSDFRNSIAVFAQSGSRLNEVACNAAFGTSSRAVFRAAAGTTYYFQISAQPIGGRIPTLVFNLSLGSPPANDDFLDAEVVGTIPFSSSVDNSDATIEPGEPRGGCGYYSLAGTVWYTYTPSADTLLVADTTGSQSDTILTVWSETIFGLYQVTCNDNFGESQQAKLAFEALAGETYFFQIGRSAFSSSAPEQSTVEFSLEVGVPPANDDFADAKPVTTLPFTQETETLTATVQDGEPRPSCVETYYDTEATLWYAFTPSVSSFIVADTEGTPNFNSFIGVYQGSSLEALTPVACGAPNYPYARLGFQVMAGQTYYIQVGNAAYVDGDFLSGGGAGEETAPVPSGVPGGSGVIVLNLESETVPACPGTEFTVEDPTGDVFGFHPDGDQFRQDITAVRGGSNSETFCLTIEFAGPIEPPDANEPNSITTIVTVDVDKDRQTGYQRFGPCGSSLGIETQIELNGRSGLLADLYSFFGPTDPENYVFASFQPQALTLIVPLGGIGGDDSFAFLVETGRLYYEPNDCAPNGGAIHSPTPLEPGDASCDGSTNAVDALVILQMVAGLAPTVPCAFVADVNQNGSIGPLDALQILQLDAGLLTEFVPAD